MSSSEKQRKKRTQRDLAVVCEVEKDNYTINRFRMPAVFKVEVLFCYG
jgi:hypothetical protein